MSWDWLNWPAVEVAFALGSSIGFAFGFWAGCSGQNFVSYHRGYRDGLKEGRRKESE